ncbi:MAG: hypothetical protein MJZ76_09825 [Bacteroidales bacterium]|nr:hypothetical protein [Bacteroidales bacterium]
METQKTFNIRLLSINGEQIINSLAKRDLSGLNEDNLVYQFRNETTLNLSDDLVTITSGIRYMYNQNELFQVQASVTYKVLNLNEIVEQDEEKSTITLAADFLPTLISAAVGVIRGILFKETKGTVLEKYPLPLLPIKLLMEKNVITVENK